MKRLEELRRRLKKTINYPHNNIESKTNELIGHCQNYVVNEGAKGRLYGVLIGLLFGMFIMYQIMK